MAEPDKPAMSAWDSDVGIPKYQAAEAQSTIAKRAAHKATKPSLLFPKLTILEMVSATDLLIIVITNTPRKFINAAIAIARFGSIDLVDITVAIAFGASVHPFTRMTPRVRRTVINNAGLPGILLINSIYTSKIVDTLILQQNMLRVPNFINSMLKQFT